MFLPQVVPLSGVHAGHLIMFTVKCALSFACSWLWKFLKLPWPGTQAPQPGPCLELLSRPWVAERKTTQVKCHFHDTPSMQLNTGGWLWVSGWGSAGSSCPSTLYFLEGSCEVPATSKEWRVFALPPRDGIMNYLEFCHTGELSLLPRLLVQSFICIRMDPW